MRDSSDSKPKSKSSSRDAISPDVENPLLFRLNWSLRWDLLSLRESANRKRIENLSFLEHHMILKKGAIDSQAYCLSPFDPIAAAAAKNEADFLLYKY